MNNRGIENVAEAARRQQNRERRRAGGKVRRFSLDQKYEQLEGLAQELEDIKALYSKNDPEFANTRVVAELDFYQIEEAKEAARTARQLLEDLPLEEEV